MTASELNSLLVSNVLEIKFARRRPVNGKPGTRRMLCTLSETILNSVNGRTVLNYIPPGKGIAYNPLSKNLSMAWDIMMQSFRMIPAETTTVINRYNASDNTFWEYFNENILPLSTEQKTFFMQS